MNEANGQSLASPLLTDLYQLTMAKTYVERGMLGEAVFEFAVRKLPPTRNFLLAAGLEQLLGYLETLRFGPADIEWLEQSGYADAAFAKFLGDFRFTGDVLAVPEGTVVFANEPLVRIVAPLPEAQLVESRLINLLQFQTMIASKAARCMLAAPGRLLVDFGMRRAHGAEAALLAARATCIAGFGGTATVLAGRLFDIPTFGTMAHSFVTAHDTEETAFEAFARSHPDNVVLLIDTYDTPRGARRVVELIPRLLESGITVRAVRLDSGNLADLSREVRSILDAGGAGDVQIFASGGLNEYALQDLVASGAPVDGYGIGTDLDVSSDAPYLDCAYKLQEYAGRVCRKRSAGKATWPGRKQIFRHLAADGTLVRDCVGLETENLAATPLMVPVMQGGRRLQDPEPLATIRTRAAASLAALPENLKALDRAETYSIEISSQVRALAERFDRQQDV